MPYAVGIPYTPSTYVPPPEPTYTPLNQTIARDLMWRSMVTTLPLSDFDQYGGYDAVKAFYERTGGAYDPNEIPVSMRKELADQVEKQGYGNYGIFNWFNIPRSQQANNTTPPPPPQTTTPPPSTPVERNYDEFGGVGYYINVPEGQDYEGNTIYRRMPVSASQIKTEVVSDGEGGNFERAVVPQSVYQEALDKYKELYVPPPVSADYSRPKEIAESQYFSQVPGMSGENVNSFSFGQFGNIWDAINSGSYKVSPDKSQLISPFGTFNLTPIGQGLYDIRIGAKSGGYDVAIGVTDEGKAVLNKDMLDKGALRYVGGSPGGFISNMIQDIGPVGNIALAIATGGLSIPEQLAAQAAYNIAGGQDVDDALKNAAITVAVSQGVQAGANELGLGNTLTNTGNIEFEPIDQVLTDMSPGADIVPVTEEQVKNLYPPNDTFTPPQTVGIQPGQIYGPGGPGYYNERTGQWVSDPNGPLPGPLNPDISGSEVTMAGWIANPLTGQWTSPSGEVFQSTPWNPDASAVSGQDLLKSANALPGGAMSIKDLATIATLANTANAIINPPSLPQATTGTSGFPLAPIPSDWRSPIYNQNFTPIDLNSLFTNQNLLIGTQWENLPPEIQFANAPTMQALTDIISGINFGQNTAGNQLVKG